VAEVVEAEAAEAEVAEVVVAEVVVAEVAVEEWVGAVAVVTSGMAVGWAPVLARAGN
jgi:hypothetical protein